MLAMMVDDSRSSLTHLARIVEASGGVDCRTFEDPQVALDIASRIRFDLAILDFDMPKMDGIALTRRLRGLPGYAQVPIIMLTASSDRAVRLRALRAGATDFLTKTSDLVEFDIKLHNMIALSRAVRQRTETVREMERAVDTATHALNAAKEEMVFRLSLAIEYRDHDTSEHTVRVARYSHMIAEELGLSGDECRRIYLAAPLHDVGKVAVPDHILLKPGRLTEAEMAVMRTHTTVGQRILGDSASELMRSAAEIAGGHHERWDGMGYPDRIAGDAIPLGARIVAVADVFDAMTTARPYKAAMPVSVALDCMAQERGRHFDPDCLDAFIAAYTRLHPEVSRADREGAPPRAAGREGPAPSSAPACPPGTAG